MSIHEALLRPTAASMKPATRRRSELVERGSTRYPGLLVAAAIAALTLLAALAGALFPELWSTAAPHPTLRGTLGEAWGIFVDNGRLLVAPLILVATRWPTGRVTRHLGDVLVAALLVVNAVVVGLALGRFSIELIPYLPHLPLEDAALATSVTAWLSRRLPAPADRTRWSLAGYASLTLALTATAALIETFLVPHAS
jgi:hypothetical protein